MSQTPNKTLSKGFKLNETSRSLLLHCYSKTDNVKRIETIEKKIYDGHVLIWSLKRFFIINRIIFRFEL